MRVQRVVSVSTPKLNTPPDSHWCRSRILDCLTRHSQAFFIFEEQGTAKCFHGGIPTSLIVRGRGFYRPDEL